VPSAVDFFRRFLPKLGYNGAIWAIAHRLARLVWKILHDAVHYVEQGTETTPRAKKRRAQKLAQALRKLGYAVTLTPITPHPLTDGRGVTFRGAGMPVAALERMDWREGFAQAPIVGQENQKLPASLPLSTKAKN
jgi:hypothetical protein